MPHLSFITGPDGHALPVMVGLNGRATAACIASGQAVTLPLLAPAVIDTGSDVTCIAGHIVRHLGLQRVLQRRTQTVAGSIPVNLFEVSLTMPRAGTLQGPLLVIDQLVVMELPHPPANIDVLLGKDVLNHLLVVLDGQRGEFTVAD